MRSTAALPAVFAALPGFVETRPGRRGFEFEESGPDVDSAEFVDVGSGAPALSPRAWRRGAGARSAVVVPADTEVSAPVVVSADATAGRPVIATPTPSNIARAPTLPTE
jgi:hypothetical protein